MTVKREYVIYQMSMLLKECAVAMLFFASVTFNDLAKVSDVSWSSLNPAAPSLLGF